MDNRICSCFGYSEEEITREVSANNGRSLIMERILAEKKCGGCHCGTSHPLGR